MHLVALAPYPEHAPSTRFRLVHFVEPLASSGIRLEILPLFDRAEYRILSDRGRGARKAGLLIRGMGRRLRQLGMAGEADAVLVHRELSPIRSGAFLRLLDRAPLPLVYDFDDAVFLPPKGGSPLLGVLRTPRASTAALCRAADLVLAGNSHLADFAREVRGREEGTTVFPTVIDTDRYRPAASASIDPDALPTVGWIGTHTTTPYLESLAGELREAAALAPFRLLVVSNREPEGLEGLPVTFQPWSEEEELRALHSMDVGLYPVPEDPWALGKCGFKAIQYMACGIPVLASPVGVLQEIVVEGETGFHARSGEDWVTGLRDLVENPSLRRRMGEAGRARAVAHYSVASSLPTLVARLRELLPPAAR